jgi:hypothetical protein
LSNIDKNYTLYIKNGDSETNQASSALISLNGEKVVKTLDKLIVMLSPFIEGSDSIQVYQI